MTRRRSPTVADERQRALPLGGIPASRPPSYLPGSLECAALVCGLVSYALDEARQVRGMSRAAVAARMAELSGESISEHMLNACSAQSHEGHRFPLQWLPALIAATGCFDVLQSVADRVGATVLVGEAADAAEVARLDQIAAQARAEKARILRRRAGG
ncbi:hypothetical protein HL658_31170 [Azospirillum sp. RWY-5-1]|uniref:XRE family transcriptional regulator n=1 Tax=Azospirillum oleiclasticum TaxID=2735135 RepID=A0ABX2TN16_9PROT|nr:hypothetical protein [Azospirillum oleiclasticum]NYZ17026.1 hypothetical protein [Azospirillum oleiclasticum]NYZ24530.1 hypothetical protein [Azospirillum oleiclasticum]